MTGTSSARARRPAGIDRAVSQPHDPAERQADKAADVAARGGSVTGWSFETVPLQAAVHREETGGSGNAEKLEKAAKKTGEALLETEAGKRLQEEIKEDPLVKKATAFLGTPAGKAVAGGAVVAGVAGLAAAKKPLPFQPPAIPLDKITPGLSAQVTVEGPLSSPSFVGLSLTYKEQLKGGKPGPAEKDKIAADIARLRAEAEMFKPQAQKEQEKAEERAAIARYLASQQSLSGRTTLIPLTPGEKPKSVDAKAEEAQKKPEPEEPPVQREPSVTASSGAAPDTRAVDGVVRGAGRSLDPGIRRSMEARFGHDFSAVRLHDDAAAAGAAADVRANAFTVGEDIVFGPGRYDPSTPEGQHLVAHELAHVVQQRQVSDR